MPTCKWLDLDFQIYPHDANLSEAAGLYVFARQDPEGWIALYIGETESFHTRLPTHERWQEAAQRGATHVHVKTEPKAAERQALEEQLIQLYQPPVNVKHKEPERCWTKPDWLA